jgi:U3 small nucleolar RNA-associated protein 12
VSGALGTEAGPAGAVAAKSLEGVKGGEMLMAALDLVEAELPRFEAEEGAAGAPGRQAQYRNPLLLGLSPHAYMLRALRSVKAPDLEHALLVLPFHYVARLIGMLIALMRRGLDVELCTKCAVHLLRCHQAQILHTHYLLEEMLALKELIASSIHSYRTLVGVNMTGLRAMKRQWEQVQEDSLGSGGPLVKLAVGK